MFEWMDHGALAETISARELRARRAQNAPRGLRRVWATVVGFLGSCALVLFLAFYVTGGDLDLVPWFLIGIAVLFAVAWFFARRSKARALRRRLRLERLAARNGILIGFDAEVAPLRLMMRGRHPNGDAFELGTVMVSETAAGGATKTVERVFLQLGAHDAISPQESPFPEVQVDEAQFAVLPTATAVLAEVQTVFRYRERTDGVTAYLMEPLDLSEVTTWRRLGDVAGWLTTQRPDRA